ncbi:MAG: hypothetical protein DSM106950_09760 [Stigonema ocellatum SAG 48.90 = DSM 106950]|nr:hypothetical protein [Stigonema ocellatum SAG 48.90 = DSM 106950]
MNYMKHPFELEISDIEAIDLDFVLPLTDESAQLVMGGVQATTNYITAKQGEAAEEGGGGHVTTEYATVQLGEAGEEGGGGHGVTTNYVTANRGEAAEEGGGLW